MESSVSSGRTSIHSIFSLMTGTSPRSEDLTYFARALMQIWLQDVKHKQTGTKFPKNSVLIALLALAKIKYTLLPITSTIKQDANLVVH